MVHKYISSLAYEEAENFNETFTLCVYRCVCKPLDDYDINKLIGEKLVVFVCSTTGQGTAPDNMRVGFYF